MTISILQVRFSSHPHRSQAQRVELIAETVSLRVIAVIPHRWRLAASGLANPGKCALYGFCLALRASYRQSFSGSVRLACFSHTVRELASAEAVDRAKTAVIFSR